MTFFFGEPIYLPITPPLPLLKKMDYFGKLNEMLIKYKDKGDILIIGDLNTRTENEDGIHEN